MAAGVSRRGRRQSACASRILMVGIKTKIALCIAKSEGTEVGESPGTNAIPSIYTYEFIM